ncbi:hypothetical protein MC885_014115, partial [Smutsia gigantea]
EKDEPPQLVTSASVKAIISRIEAAQLTRAQEGDLGYNLKEKTKSHQMEKRGKKRFVFLEKIASFSKDAKTKEKRLYEIFHWLGDGGDSLTCEIRNRKSVEEEEALYEWIEVMEKEQSLQKSTSYPQPLSPEQMLQDKQTTCTSVSKVKSMLQELLDSTIFSQGEVRAIRYMSTVVDNLNKALIIQHKENRSLETKYTYLKMEMTKDLSSQRLYFQKSLQVLENKRDALLKQVEVLGEKYHVLLLIKHALEFQLKKAQSARGQAEDLAKIFTDSLGPPEKETPPKKETVVPVEEETQQEPKEVEQLFSPPSRSPMATWNSGAGPSTYQPLPTMTTDSRIADVYSSKDTECLQPVLLSSVDHKFPKRWERPIEGSPGQKVKDQKDFFQEAVQEEEGLQIKSQFRKQLSPESSKKVALESQGEHQKRN